MSPQQDSPPNTASGENQRGTNRTDLLLSFRFHFGDFSLQLPVKLVEYVKMPRKRETYEFSLLKAFRDSFV